MIKAVFFDWFNTITTYHPPRENTYAQVCRELGYEVSTGQLTRGLLLADQYFSDENGRAPLSRRKPEEVAGVYIRYGKIILENAGLPATDEHVLLIMEKIKGIFSGSGFALYDDVVPALNEIRSRKLRMGLISNIEQDIGPVCRELGLDGYLSVVVTSRSAGVEKPRPGIFRAALAEASVEASEAIYVGDQYNCDVLGARGAGMKPVLIDRYGLFPDIKDCTRITALTQLTEYL